MPTIPLIAQIVVALAAVVVIAEFYIVFRRRADRRIIEKLNNIKEQ